MRWARAQPGVGGCAQARSCLARRWSAPAQPISVHVRAHCLGVRTSRWVCAWIILLGVEMPCACLARRRTYACSAPRRMGRWVWAGVFLLGAEMACTCSAHRRACVCSARRHTGKWVCAGVLLLGAEMTCACSARRGYCQPNGPGYPP